MIGSTRSQDQAGIELRDSPVRSAIDENPPILDNFGQTVDFEGNPTVTYRANGELPLDLDDGFPAIDDLTGGLLGQYSRKFASNSGLRPVLSPTWCILTWSPCTTWEAIATTTSSRWNTLPAGSA
jgi:hypothetical protein